MWYRGPDLRLAMVNSAYVRAVEGQDARDVVSRGVELIEGSGTGGPLGNRFFTGVLVAMASRSMPPPSTWSSTQARTSG